MTLGKQKRTVLTVGGIDFEIDATLNISYSSDSDTTDHPIEDGSEITDHVDLKPLTIDLDAVMSEAPIKKDFLASAAAIFSNGFQWAFVETILEARKAKQLVSVDANERGQWDNLVITSFNPSWSVSDGNSVSFRMSLKQITRVKSKTELANFNDIGAALSEFLLFSEPKAAATSAVQATSSQGALMDSAGSYPGVTVGVDFVLGREA